MVEMKKVGKPHDQSKIHTKNHLSLKIDFVDFLVPELKKNHKI